MIRGSVTRRLTSILESARHELLPTSVEKTSQDGSLYLPTDQERLVFNSSDIHSSQPITALPCPLGIMGDEELVEVFAKYIALPSLATKAFTGNASRPYFIGCRGFEKIVDIYGDVVA